MLKLLSRGSGSGGRGQAAMMTYGEAIRTIFEESGMTQAEFARKGNFSTAYVSMLLSGKVTNPKFDRACEVADALSVPLQRFYELMRG